ncbi:MAG: hypothetical protein CFE25_07585 [Chitinophagaceae bacterium BSSC1]|nr:MAG: hypothetical protein CFE25_07585 [Chitinophagaceae bacterium BSSC1]
MYIIGHKSISQAKEMVQEKCPNCASNHSLEMEVFQKYVHFFYIPYLPAGKTGVSYCSNCKQVMVDKDMPANLKAAYHQLKAKTRIPIWMFSGLALMILLIVYQLNNEQRAQKALATQMDQVAAGDVLELKLAKDNFTLYKVYRVNADSVLLQANEYQSTTVAGLKDIKDSLYATNLRYITKPELKKMAMDGGLVGIEKP